jgi:hypothetical protein
MRTGRPARRATARYQREEPEYTQLSALNSPLEELAGHDDPLDLVGALVDLGDRESKGSLRRQKARQAASVSTDSAPSSQVAARHLAISW